MNNFKEVLENILNNYIGLSESEIIEKLKLKFEDKYPKNIRNILVKKILKENLSEIENILIDKNIKIRTIRVDNENNLFESLSFSQIKYEQIIHEDWENSQFYRDLKSEFLFIIFKETSLKINTFCKIKFWQMNSKDFEIASMFWELTKNNIERGDYQNFVNISTNFLCHVRTKGLNSKDLMRTPQGTLEPKRGFWLNSKYIKTQLF